MSREIFISYSRRDQEFVTRLASDLNAQVAGVWFEPIHDPARTALA